MEKPEEKISYVVVDVHIICSRFGEINLGTKMVSPVPHPGRCFCGDQLMVTVSHDFVTIIDERMFAYPTTNQFNHHQIRESKRRVIESI